MTSKQLQKEKGKTVPVAASAYLEAIQPAGPILSRLGIMPGGIIQDCTKADTERDLVWTRRMGYVLRRHNVM
jgi:hypothetical protein